MFAEDCPEVRFGFWPLDSVASNALFRRHKKSTYNKSRRRLIVVANIAQGFSAAKNIPATRGQYGQLYRVRLCLHYTG